MKKSIPLKTTRILIICYFFEEAHPISFPHLFYFFAFIPKLISQFLLIAFGKVSSLRRDYVKEIPASCLNF